MKDIVQVLKDIGPAINWSEMERTLGFYKQKISGLMRGKSALSKKDEMRVREYIRKIGDAAK